MIVNDEYSYRICVRPDESASSHSSSFERAFVEKYAPSPHTLTESPLPVARNSLCTRLNSTQCTGVEPSSTGNDFTGCSVFAWRLVGGRRWMGAIRRKRSTSTREHRSVQLIRAPTSRQPFSNCQDSLNRVQQATQSGLQCMAYIEIIQMGEPVPGGYRKHRGSMR